MQLADDNPGMTDILDLPGWEVIAKTTEDGTDVLAARYLPQPEACLKCGTIGELYRHGTKVVEYLDSPMRGSPARLRATVQRFRCRSCSETFLQPLGGIQPERRMTERCASFIQARCLRDTFTRLAEDVGCDDKTVRNLAAEYIERLQGAYKPVLPEYLGIDETTIDGSLRLVLTDIGNRKPVEVMQSMKLEQQGRCQSCGVELGRSKKTFPHIAVIVRGKERKRILICGLCFEGFHTRSLSRTFVPSTQ